ncbi:hypothetical protein G7Z17_g1122 [Cylindrodendrum hubeiense]|uniref:Mid2 domain-containing protein n=1 Tax=Cylindrodendrum hubeiense TaxID=595255 RepID=A0A9P5HJW1_9HYPO|nr:hypothetical protein G7Z17_g1122 [Cylindrodendrum hubeiense]
MLFTRSVAALALLGTAVATDAYVPVHKRFTYDVAVNDFSYLGMLSKRDSCSDAFGDNAHNSNCAPDFTLCCTRDGESYPSCEKWLDKGWCCVGDGETDKCYVDQVSVCDEDSSVACTSLQEGTDRACCPKLTTCDESVPASVAYVRCNINRSDLLVADAAANGKSSMIESSTIESSTTEALSTSTEASTSTSADSSKTTQPESQTESATSTPDDKPTPLAGGVIGGIVVAAVVGVAGIGVLVFWLLRRSKKAKYEAANQSPPQPSIPQYYQDQQVKYQQEQQAYYQTGPPNQYGGYMYPQQQPQPPAELMDQRPPVELDSSVPHPTSR